MAQFRFRLETLRKLRIAHRDEVQGKLADAYQAAQVLEQRQQTIADELMALQASQRRATTGKIADVNTLLNAQRYQSVLRSQQATLQHQSNQLKDEIEKRRLAVVEADREVRVLDKLEERQQFLFQQQTMKTETKISDEIASQRAGGHQAWRE